MTEYSEQMCYTAALEDPGETVILFISKLECMSLLLQEEKCICLAFFITAQW